MVPKVHIRSFAIKWLLRFMLDHLLVAPKMHARSFEAVVCWLFLQQSGSKDCVGSFVRKWLLSCMLDCLQECGS